jgi:hypothetical protein
MTKFCYNEYNLVMHTNSIVLRVHCTWGNENWFAKSNNRIIYVYLSLKHGRVERMCSEEFQMYNMKLRGGGGNKTFQSRSVVKHKGMVFGFWKMATAVTRPER